jgi:flagellar hook-associated protein 3 FlgL
MQTEVGIMQSRTKTASTDLQAQKDLLAKSLSQVTGVDQYEVATRVNQLTTQLQTSYSLTSRMQQLSLLQYL